MIKCLAIIALCGALSACSSAPPECGDKEVLKLVLQLVEKDFVIALPSETRWTFNAPRTTALDEKIASRVCALDASHASKVLNVRDPAHPLDMNGSVVITYRISFTDDKRLYVNLIDF